MHADLRAATRFLARKFFDGYSGFCALTHHKNAREVNIFPDVSSLLMDVAPRVSRKCVSRKFALQRRVRVLARVVLLAIALAMLGVAHCDSEAHAAARPETQSRVLATPRHKVWRATKVAATTGAKATTQHRQVESATWRVWLIAQFLALGFGLCVVARAESLEQRRVRTHSAPLPPWRGAAAMMRRAASLALLCAFSLPIAALWLSARGGEYSRSAAAQLAVALSLAMLALLVGRYRARGLGTFALLLCAGAGVFTLTLFLLGDALSRYASLARYASFAQHLPAWMLHSGGWLGNAPMAQSAGATTWNEALHASHLGAMNSGFFIAATLVGGVAAVMAAQMSRRTLFEKPPLEVRHTHPLSTAWAPETRAQIRLLEICGLGAFFLSLQPLGNAPLPAIALSTSAALMLWGWRHRVLDARRIFGALLGASCAAALLLVLWLAGAHLDARFRNAPSRDAPSREYPPHEKTKSRTSAQLKSAANSVAHKTREYSQQRHRAALGHREALTDSQQKAKALFLVHPSREYSRARFATTTRNKKVASLAATFSHVTRQAPSRKNAAFHASWHAREYSRASHQTRRALVLREYPRESRAAFLQESASLRALPRSREYSRDESHARQGAVAVAFIAQASAASDAAVKHASSARKSVAEKRASTRLHALRARSSRALRALYDEAITRAALLTWLISLGALLPLLRRPPPVLWRVLGHAPAWGWMLLGGVLAAPILLVSQGAFAFFTMLGTLLCAFVFVWLEGF